MAHIIHKISFDIYQSINGDLFNLQIGNVIGAPTWLILHALRPDFLTVTAWYDTILAVAKRMHDGGAIDEDECIKILQSFPLPPGIRHYF